MLEDSNFQVTMSEYLPLRDVVFNTLRHAILKGELEPGERLMEIALAQKLGVSRTPIREAIRKLELEGLVVMVPRKGAEVADITEKDLRDVLEVRTALEELSIELAMKNMNDDDCKQLTEANKLFAKDSEGDDLIKIAEADVAFHELIYMATGNKRLIQMINNLREQMYRYRLEYIKDKSTHARLVDEHNRIIDAMVKNDVAAAKAAIKLHVENQEENILKSIKVKKA
ncbi:transcriptional regulator GntR family [Firmicutes bacterium CAG:882]|jgi:DNA-binding GntR family transcriptional regulator|nr:transcriptional regulator GntR family [Firmicutes bacterium CAG:882]